MEKERKYLRRLVKAIMGGAVSWVEPNMSSTVGAGVPDCKFRVDENEFPVELKVWEINKKGLKSDMRPAQIRYHVMAARKRIKTAILFALPVDGSDDHYLYLVPNRKCPVDNYILDLENDCWIVGSTKNGTMTIKRKIFETLSSRGFWGYDS